MNDLFNQNVTNEGLVLRFQFIYEETTPFSLLR